MLLHCPEYDICRQEYPELFWGTNMNMKNISDYDNQETIAQLYHIGLLSVDVV